MIDSLILDWSGTLVDDVSWTLEATNRTLRHFGGAEVDLATYRAEFTIPVDGFYQQYIPGRTLDEIDPVFFDAYRGMASEIPFFPGVVELLSLARARGVGVFVLTTQPNDIVEPILEDRGLAGFFKGVHGGAYDKRQVLPKILETYQLVPDNTLFVGDSDHDIEAGHGAHVRTGAALYGYSPSGRLESVGPDYRFGSVGEIMSCLDQEHLLSSVPRAIATVGGVILDGDGKLLVVRTRKWSGTYGIPGGKIEYGETMEEAYAREIMEETGLELTDTRFVMIQDCIESDEFVEPMHFLLINYVSKALNPGELRHNYEIEEARWVTLEEARSLKLNQPTRVVLEEAEGRGWI